MFSKELLKGQVAIITGGGSGLGKAMAAKFLNYGAKVVIASRRLELLEETARELDPSGDNILPLQCDVRFLTDVENVINTAYERFGHVGILVNNAAGNYVSPTERLSPNAFKLITDIVLMGTVNFTLTMGKRWIEEEYKGGTVLNILACYSQTGTGFAVPSACAKAGVEAMTKSLAAEWGHRHDMRFVGIAPGATPTKGAFDRLIPEPKFKDHVLNTIPLKRFGDPDEVADLATFLVSPMGSYISGETVRIDGGKTVSLASEFNYLDQVSDDEWDGYLPKMKKRNRKKTA